MMDYPRASIYRLVGHIILLRQSARKVMETYISVEEDEAAKQLEFDLDILAAVDAIQADDDLLATTIYESVRQTQLDLDPEAILDFAFQILGNHSQRSADDLRSSLPLDLSSVTKRTWMAIADIVAEAISYGISIQLARDRSVSWKDWMSDALLLLVSPGPSSHLFTDHGRKFIKTCITYAPSETSHTLISRYSTPHSAAPTGGWEVVVRILLANGILQQCSNADIFSFSKSTAMNLKATSLLDMTTRALTLELSENHIWTLVMVAAEALHRQLDDVLAASTPWETWMDEALLFICKATGNKYWLQTDLIRGIHGKLLVGLSAPHFLRFLANPSNAEILENDTMRKDP
ncbi:hypothetical protein EW026_g5450 [Hermanssonia centrifuga]|uniref:Uncharacterized protein n=1 Tax=Hermanssonia centrifuga TaxID=98765 RepID=A0A4V3XA22_9APHY|nr:hypothetical protein EW026_g5450 [Hermanssonia centrifuga]